MSTTIDTSFVEQFSAATVLTMEQRMSKLRQTVAMEGMNGKAMAVERVGTTQDLANVVTTRHGDTPINDTPHTRRWIHPQNYDVADLLDQEDAARLLIQPMNDYQIKHAGVMGRQLDSIIITAALENATTGEDAGGSVALPSSQQVAHGSTGMTVEKLLEANEIFEENDAPEGVPRFLVLTPKALTELLNDSRLTSADYNTVRALQNGTVDSFMGFRFITISSTRLPVASNIRSHVAMMAGAVKVGELSPMRSRMDPRPDKRYLLQLYTSAAWGATRIEEERVVEIQTDES